MPLCIKASYASEGRGRHDGNGLERQNLLLHPGQKCGLHPEPSVRYRASAHPLRADSLNDAQADLRISSLNARGQLNPSTSAIESRTPG